jgi:hypothetical protein
MFEPHYSIIFWFKYFSTFAISSGLPTFNSLYFKLSTYYNVYIL